MESLFTYLFNGFAISSFAYISMRLFRPQLLKENWVKFDEYSCRLMAKVGVMFLFVSALVAYQEFRDLIVEKEIQAFKQQVFGKYWFGYWSTPLIYFLVSQLLQIRKVKTNLWFRFIIAVLFLVTLEFIIIQLVNLQRDYLQSSRSIPIWDKMQSVFYGCLTFALLSIPMFVIELRKKKKSID